MIELIKNLFTSKKKKLILDIKKKHNKNISDYDIYDYRRKHIKQPDSISDNDILMLILLEDAKSTESTRNDDYYSSSSSSSYDSGSCSGSSSSSSDCSSSSSCD